MGVGRLCRTNKRYLATCTCRAHTRTVGLAARLCAAAVGEEVSAAAAQHAAVIRWRRCLMSDKRDQARLFIL